MNEELQKALGELLSKANNGIDTAGEFLSAELPDVIHQLLMWHGVYSFVIFTVGLLVILSIPFQIKKLLNIIPEQIKEGDKDNWYWKDENRNYSTFGFKVVKTHSAEFLHGVVCFSIFIELAVSCAALNLTWLQIWIAPKVWLLEYAAKLTN